MSTRKFAFGGVAALVTLVLVILALPRLIGLDTLKPRIASEFRAATGWTLLLDGELDIEFVPFPRVAISDARIVDSGRDPASELATVKAFTAGFRLLPLLHGNLELTDIEIVEPSVELKRLEDGSGNWRLARQPLPPALETEATPAAGGATPIGSLRIVDGTVSFRHADGTVERVERITVDVTTDSLAGPFVASGTLDVRGRTATVDLRAGRRAAGEDIPVRLHMDLAAGAAVLSLQGTLRPSDGALRLTAEAGLRGPGLARAAAVVGWGAVPAGLDRPFDISANVTADGEVIRLDGLSVALDDIVLTGEAALPQAGPARVALGAGRVDADRLLRMAERPEDDPGPAPGQRPERAGVRLPEHVEAEATLTVDELVLGGKPVRLLRIDASMEDGEVSLAGLSAHLPGDAILELAGAATAYGGDLAYRGEVSLRAERTDSLAEWLGIGAADRLRRLSMAAGFEGDVSELRLTGLRAQVDASNLSGGVTLALSRRLSFGASLGIDHLNLDTYLAGGAARAAPAEGEATGETDGAKNPLAFPAALGGFDANLALRVGTLGYRGAVANGVRLDGSLRDGTITIEEASVRNLGGASLKLKGTLSGLAGDLEAEAEVAAAADDPRRLFRALGLGPLAVPGQFRLSAAAAARRGGSTIDMKLEMAGATLAAAGTAPPLAALLAGSVDAGRELRVEAQHPDLAWLAGLLGGRNSGSGGGAVRAEIAVTSADGGVDVRTETKFRDGSLKLSGKIADPLGSPEFDLAADLRHRDIVRLVRLFAPGDDAPVLGGVALSAALRGGGDSVAVEEIEGRLGDLEIAGQGKYFFATPRPRVEIDLTSGALSFDGPELSAENGAPAGGDGNGGPLPHPALGLAIPAGLDAAIRLRPEAVLYGPFRVDGPRIVAEVKDRTLSIEEFAGTLSGGALTMTGTLDAGDDPSANIALAVAGASVAGTLFDTGGFGIADGDLDLALELAIRGKTEPAIRTLVGSGRLSVRDGLVHGLDLAKIGPALRDSDAALAALLEAALGTGTTPFTSLEGAFEIDKGVVRVTDLRLAAPAVSAAAAGTVDLGAWNMDLESEFRLADAADAPPFRLRLAGPPDRARPAFDSKDLRIWALARGVAGLLKSGESGGEDGTPAAPAEKEEPPQDLDPGGVVRDLIRDLR